MRIAIRSIFFAGILSMGAAVNASADTHDHQLEVLARFTKYAGAPVEQFHMVDVFQTQIVGDRNVVVWPLINEAFLITVEKPCVNLEWAKGFGLTQETSMTVTKRFDFIEFGSQKCKITEIRPVDYKAMLKADKEANPSQAGGT
jgi:hypothetical protein